MQEFYKIYVYPDDENYSTPPTWKSDDYRVVEVALCPKCDDMPYVDYNTLTTGCSCRQVADRRMVSHD